MTVSWHRTVLGINGRNSIGRKSVKNCDRFRSVQEDQNLIAGTYQQQQQQPSKIASSPNFAVVFWKFQ